MFHRPDLTEKSLTHETRSTQELLSTTFTHADQAIRPPSQLQGTSKVKNPLKTDISQILGLSKAREEYNSMQTPVTKIDSHIHFENMGSPSKPANVKPFNIFGGFHKSDYKAKDRTPVLQTQNQRLLNSNSIAKFVPEKSPDRIGFDSNGLSRVNGLNQFHYNEQVRRNEGGPSGRKNLLAESKSIESKGRTARGEIVKRNTIFDFRPMNGVSIQQNLIKSSQMAYQNLEKRLNVPKRNMRELADLPEARMLKVQNALSQMKNKLYEIKIFSCTCDLFRFDIQSKLIRMLENPKHTRLPLLSRHQGTLRGLQQHDVQLHSLRDQRTNHQGHLANLLKLPILQQTV
jgi:hypothetical protein